MATDAVILRLEKVTEQHAEIQLRLLVEGVDRDAFGQQRLGQRALEVEARHHRPEAPLDDESDQPVPSVPGVVRPPPPGPDPDPETGPAPPGGEPAVA